MSLNWMGDVHHQLVSRVRRSKRQLPIRYPLEPSSGSSLITYSRGNIANIRDKNQNESLGMNSESMADRQRNDINAKLSWPVFLSCDREIWRYMIMLHLWRIHTYTALLIQNKRVTLEEPVDSKQNDNNDKRWNVWGERMTWISTEPRVDDRHSKLSRLMHKVSSLFHAIRIHSAMVDRNLNICDPLKLGSTNSQNDNMKLK